MKMAGVMAGLVLMASSGPGWASDPRGILGQFEAALNAGNVEACVAWMAADGVIRERSGKEIRGRADLTDYLEGLARHRYQTDAEGHDVRGNHVTWSAKVTFEDLRAMGLEAMRGKGEAVVEGGKIKVYTPVFSPGSMLMLVTAASRVREDLVRRMIRDVVNDAKRGASDEYFSGGFKDHNPLRGERGDASGFVDGFQRLREAFPNLKVEVDQVAGLDDLVVARTTMTGRHEKEYMGRQPTYREMKIGSVELFRLADGKIVERWGQRDECELEKVTGVGPKVEKTQERRKEKGKSGGILGWFFNLFS